MESPGQLTLIGLVSQGVLKNKKKKRIKLKPKSNQSGKQVSYKGPKIRLNHVCFGNSAAEVTWVINIFRVPKKNNCNKFKCCTNSSIFEYLILYQFLVILFSCQRKKSRAYYHLYFKTTSKCYNKLF